VLVVPNHVPVVEGPGRVLVDTLVGMSATSLFDLPALSRWS